MSRERKYDIDSQYNPSYFINTRGNDLLIFVPRNMEHTRHQEPKADTGQENSHHDQRIDVSNHQFIDYNSYHNDRNEEVYFHS